MARTVHTLRFEPVQRRQQGVHLCMHTLWGTLQDTRTKGVRLRYSDSVTVRTHCRTESPHRSTDCGGCIEASSFNCLLNSGGLQGRVAPIPLECNNTVAVPANSRCGGG